MQAALDHVVHVVRDLEQAAAQFAELGFFVAPGGVHPHWGTQNRLIFFDLTYIELVAVGEPARAAGSGFGDIVLERLARGEGPETACFASADIAGLAAHMRGAGVAVTGPDAGSRTRPDGSVVAWQGAFPPQPWPFLIQWAESPAARRADLSSRGAIAEHPLSPGLRLQQVGWAVRDLEAAAAYLKRLYGVEALGEAFVDEQLGAHCQRTSASLMLCAPLGPGIAAEAMAQHGERPFLYEIAGPELRPALIPPAEALGAWIRLLPLR